VTDEPPIPTGPDAEPASVDTDVAQPARIADYLLGGDDNFAVDRKVIDYISAALPGGMETARAMVHASGAFMRRTVRYLVGEAGIRQFLNLGTPLPNENNLHQVAQKLAPESRIVYVIRDPVVLAHAHQLLGSTPEGATAFVHGHLRDPEAILQKASSTLDLTQPVAVVFIGRLHFIVDDDRARRVVAQLLQGVPSGSYLTISHLASDLEIEGLPEAAERLDQMAEETMMRTVALRSYAEVGRFFDGLEMVDPGVVPLNRWRPNKSSTTPSDGSETAIYGGVGRKP
jgi:hypothetical protein